MSSVKIDVAVFHRRLKRAIDMFKVSPEYFGNADALIVAVSTSDDGNIYQKGPSFQTWLLGYEFTDTVLAITKDLRVIFLSSPKKISYLEPLKDGPTKVELISRTKENYRFDDFFAAVGAKKSIGVVQKDKLSGKFGQEWKTAVLLSKLESMDAAVGFSMCLASKETAELANIATASRVAAAVLKNFFLEEMSAIIDDDKKVTHTDLSLRIEATLGDTVERSAKLYGFPGDVDLKMLDWCYEPIVQSSGDGAKGEFDFRPNAINTSSPLHFGTIVCSLGVRYRDYCSNVARTFMINPSTYQEKCYEFLLSLHAKIVELLSPGTRCCDVYAGALGFLRTRRPDLETAFPKTLGFATGIEFRENMFVLSAGNENAIHDGCAFNVVVSLLDLVNDSVTDPKNKVFSMLVSDTVSVTAAKNTILTSKAPRSSDDVAFLIEDAAVDSIDSTTTRQRNKAAAAGAKSTNSGAKGSTTLASSASSELLRNHWGNSKSSSSSSTVGSKATTARVQQQQQQSSENGASSSGRPVRSSALGTAGMVRDHGRRVPTAHVALNLARMEHQRELAKALQEQGTKRFAQIAAGSGDAGAAEPTFRKYEAYKSTAGLPRDCGLRVYVDSRCECVILPINGLAVPMHITTIKNVSKNDEGEYMYLRINFVVPGQGITRKDEKPFEDSQATFVKTLTYRSTDTLRMAEVYRQIVELKKQAQKAEAERKDMANLVEQASLLEIKDHRPLSLRDVYARPTLDSKRVPGELQVHRNGLRYVSRIKRENKIDVLFSNVRHLIFQPCDKENVVIIHVHLRTPIMIGKKKTTDVQFYRETSDTAFEDTGNRRRRTTYGDEDELLEEQEELQRRAKLNREFKEFGERIVAAQEAGTRLELDIPYRDLGFEGVPSRSSVLMQPTSECLVHLTEPPFFIVTLADVEMVHFERVAFGLKHFDMVIIFSDFSRAPAHINAIPIGRLEGIKDWLDSMNVYFSEGELNYNWGEILKTIIADPVAFFSDGGWSFIAGKSASESDDSDHSDGSDEQVDMEKMTGEASSSDYTEDDDSEDSGSGEESFEEEDEESSEDEDDSEYEDSRKGRSKSQAKRR